MKHTASKRFWQCFEALPAEVQALARRNFALLRTDSSHPSLQFKTGAGGKFHSVRVSGSQSFPVRDYERIAVKCVDVYGNESVVVRDLL